MDREVRVEFSVPKEIGIGLTGVCTFVRTMRQGAG